MKIICSASKGVDEQLDTAQLRRMLKFIHKFGGLTSQVVLGHWEGKREIALEVQGFVDCEDMLRFSEWVIQAFNQDCTYMEYMGRAYLVHPVATGGVQSEFIGTESPRTDPKAVKSPVNYTEYLDGTIIYTTGSKASNLLQ